MQTGIADLITPGLGWYVVQLLWLKKELQGLFSHRHTVVGSFKPGLGKELSRVSSVTTRRKCTVASFHSCLKLIWHLWRAAPGFAQIIF